MIISFKTRVAALFVLGFLVSCGTPLSYQRIARQLESKNYDAAQKEINKVLKKDSLNARVHYYNVYTLNEKARLVESAYDRYDYYTPMMESFEIAEKEWVEKKRKASLKKLREIRDEAWIRELNVASDQIEKVRSLESDDWYTVIDAVDNSLLLKKDSLRYVYLQLEAFVMLDDYEALEKIVNRYEKDLGTEADYAYYRALANIRNKNFKEGTFWLSKVQNVPPNGLLADLLILNDKPYDVLRESLPLIKKEEPGPSFLKVLALNFYSILENELPADTALLNNYMRYFNIPDQYIKADSTLNLKISRLVDFSLQRVSGQVDVSNAQFRAILFTNLASLLQKKLSADGTLKEDAIYFYRKAIPEWALIIYRYKVDQVESAKTLLKIYELLNDFERADDLRFDFNL